MVLQSSGSISLGDINVELQRNRTSTISLSESDVRLLAKKSAGIIKSSDLYGKSYIFTATIDVNVQEINLETWAKFYGWNGIFPAVITINPGVYVWSNNTAVPALTTGTFPRGLTIINNGFIMGRGGNGGDGAGNNNVTGNLPGQAGGPAITLGSNTVINMAGANSYIGGGGGGGGGSEWGAGGGGAGGGSGGNSYYASGSADGSQLGGAGGAIGLSGANGEEQWSEYAQYGRGGSAGGGGGSGLDINKETDNSAGGGGGGRIFPGVTTTGNPPNYGTQPGGAGGAAGIPGGNGADRQGGGGGGWGSAGGSSFNRAGGAAGRAIVLNGYSCNTIGATNRIYGAIS